jgi:excisionase family DNA binding protein
MQIADEYLTTAEAARLLDLSVGTVQKMVTLGKLEAFYTQGGHRRIFKKSLNDYMIENGYIKVVDQKFITVFHHGDDIDPLLANHKDGCVIQMMDHPFDILELNKSSDVILIDARLDWLKGMANDLCVRLVRRFKIYIYNSQNLESNDINFSHRNLNFIEGNVNSSWLFGYLLGQETAGHKPRALGFRSM